MAAPTAITSLTAVAASNGPDGATELPSVLDDYQQAHAALFRRYVSGALSTISATATLAVPNDYGYIEVGGSGEIVDIDDATTWDGRRMVFRFNAAATLSHSTNFALPLAQQIVTAAGDHAIFVRRSLGNYECVSYERRSAGPEVVTTLDVRGQASFSGTMNVGGPITAASTLDIRSQASFSASVNVGGSLDVHGPASFSASLNAGGPLLALSALDVRGQASFSASLIAGGSLLVGGQSDFRTQASFSATLNAGGPLFARGTFDVSGNASFSASLNVGGPLTAFGRLDVRGTSSFSATVTVQKLIAQNEVAAASFSGVSFNAGAEIVAASFSGAAVASQAVMEAATSTGTLVSPGRLHFHPAAAKAWGFADVSGIALASYNLTSVSDNGTGDVTFTWATDFSSGNYASFGTANYTPGGTTGSTLVTGVLVPVSATAVRIQSPRVSDGALADPSNWSAVAFGDQ